MAHTIRRKNYLPRDIVLELVSLYFPDGDFSHFDYVEMEGDARAEAVRKWRGDTVRMKRHGKTPKTFRRQEECRHRIACKSELVRFIKHPDYEPLILSKKPMYYWD